METRRFIPAGAGNTRNRQLSGWLLQVYPRWRGEHLFHHRTVNVGAGLSPLARGTRRGATGTRDARRFIPAGAGNTTGPATATRSKPVYPRWRGEHSGALRRGCPACGLSPLARGTLWKMACRLVICRFIPAGAGNTRENLVSWLITVVYPRWRGEHTSRTSTSAGAFGLSPLARGTQRSRH